MISEAITIKRWPNSLNTANDGQQLPSVWKTVLIKQNNQSQNRTESTYEINRMKNEKKKYTVILV